MRRCNRTGHAVSLKAANGVELLIHVGIDTVELQGRHFTAHCAVGDSVKRGQLLIAFDAEAIADEGYDTITPFVVCGAGDFKDFHAVSGGAVAEGETVICLS